MADRYQQQVFDHGYQQQQQLQNHHQQPQQQQNLHFQQEQQQNRNLQLQQQQNLHLQQQQQNHNLQQQQQQNVLLHQQQQQQHPQQSRGILIQEDSGYVQGFDSPLPKHQNNHENQQYIPLQGDQDTIIENLAVKVENLVGEVHNLSGIIEILMGEQKLTREKYITLKSRFNTLIIEQQKEDILSHNPYRLKEGSNAERYNQQQKKEMYDLLVSAGNNKSPTSPRKMISTMGVLYKDQLVSQQFLQDRVEQLEMEIYYLKEENLQFKNKLDTHNQRLFESQNEEKNKRQQSKNVTEQPKPKFSGYNSINTMVQRYIDGV